MCTKWQHTWTPPFVMSHGAAPVQDELQQPQPGDTHQTVAAVLRFPPKKHPKMKKWKKVRHFFLAVGCKQKAKYVFLADLYSLMDNMLHQAPLLEYCVKKQDLTIGRIWYFVDCTYKINCKGSEVRSATSSFVEILRQSAVSFFFCN